MPEIDQLGDRLLVVFDGHCGFCNGWVRWLLRRDRRDRLRFAPSTAPALKPLMAGYADLLDPAGNPSTVFVFRNPFQSNQKALTRFPAIAAALRELPFPWPIFGTLLAWLPAFIGDPLYRLIARWRYRIWGRLDACPIPTAEERNRFLSGAITPP